jgi:hypothetical protein
MAEEPVRPIPVKPRQIRSTSTDEGVNVISREEFERYYERTSPIGTLTFISEENLLQINIGVNYWAEVLIEKPVEPRS